MPRIDNSFCQILSFVGPSPRTIMLRVKLSASLSKVQYRRASPSVQHAFFVELLRKNKLASKACHSTEPVRLYCTLIKLRRICEVGYSFGDSPVLFFGNV